MADSTHYQGVQKASTGFKLLKSMGWSEGEGLGANKQGLKEHIRVKKKYEMWGVGAVESHNRTSNWSNGMSEFHRVLSSLSEITSKHADGSGSEEADGVDEVEDRPAGRGKEGQGDEGKTRKKDKKKEKGKRKGKEKEKEKEKKRKRMDDAGKSVEAAEVMAAREKGLKKKATHIGRFKRRENSKMVKGYSTSDLAAILGEDPFAKQAEAMSAIQNTVKQVGSSSDDDDILDHNPVATEQPATEASKSNKAQVDTWWAGYFMVGPRAGSRGEKAAIKKKGKKVGFSEADQEALDAWAHSHATHGKVGLGRSSMQKTIGGAKWEGTKTMLGSESDVDDEAEMVIDDEEIGDDDSHEDNGIQIVMPQKRTVAVADEAGDAGDADDTLKRVRILLSKEKKKELKVKVLAKAVDISKGDLVERLKAKPEFKLSRSKSRVRLVL